jgi:guanylate kinase
MNIKKFNKLIIISGPSGVGKSEIVKKLLKIKELNLSYSISSTTRSKRENEEEGKNYFFISKKEFENKIKNNQFLEYIYFVENYYGTLKERLFDLLSKKNVLLEIDFIGCKKIVDYFKKNNQKIDILTIFIKPPSFLSLIQRIKNRKTETDDLISKRMEKVDKELNNQSYYHHVIINDQIDDSVSNIKNICLKFLNDEIINRS